ncbi:MAG TPA: TOBE domain-containing protein, partial [Paracoccaceae bacterium]|nr:TOBE domain-containing protein [Paracoccaceae bacterium]
SDRVAIMHQGRVLQFDRPEVIYRRPADPYVAGFVGFENLVPLAVTARDGALVTAGPLTLSQEEYGPIPDRFTLAARPEGLAVTADAPGIPGRVSLRTYLGRAYQYRCETALGPLTGNGPLGAPLEPGSAVRLVPQPEQCCILAAEVD